MQGSQRKRLFPLTIPGLALLAKASSLTVISVNKNVEILSCFVCLLPDLLIYAVWHHQVDLNGHFLRSVVDWNCSFHIPCDVHGVPTNNVIN